MKNLAIGLVISVTIFAIGQMLNTVLKQRATEAQEQKMKACLQTSFDGYTKDWNNACKLSGAGENCALPIYKATILDNNRKENDELCLKMYIKKGE